MKEKKELKDLMIGEKSVQDILNALWIADSNQITKYLAMYPKYVETGSILFLGLNPSFSNLTVKNISHWEMNFNTSFKDSCSKPYSYYKKFFVIKDKIHENRKDYYFSYMDLLYIQCSKQRELYEYTEHDFLISQARLTIDIIKSIKPKLVIVCNAFADKLLHLYGNKIGFSPILQNEIYQVDEIPFIIKESRYISNRIMWNSDLVRRDIMYNEIEKILNKTN